TGSPYNIILKVKIQVTFLINDELEEIDYILSEHFARIGWQSRRQVGIADNRNTIGDNSFIVLGELAVAAGRGSQVNNNRASSHGCHCFFSEQQRSTL